MFYAKYNINNFDKNILTESEKSVHLMIKNDPLDIFTWYEIKEELKQGINYFKTGEGNFTKYLYPRLIALYYLVFDYNLYENSEKQIIKKGIHFKFLIFQILLYYLSLLFLYLKLRKKIDNKSLFFSLLFLSIEPTLFQYHGSFWSESIFFSIQVIIMSLVLSNHISNTKFLFIGIFLSLLSLQRSNGLYYFIPIVLYFFFTKIFL